MPSLVNARADLDGADGWKQAIVDGIGKSVQQHSSQALIHSRTDLRRLLEHLHDRIHIRDELLTKAASRTRIPCVRLVYIILGQAGELNRPRHGADRRTRALTSSQVRVPISVGSASRSSRSSRCQSGTGTLSGDAAKLSQASSMS